MDYKRKAKKSNLKQFSPHSVFEVRNTEKNYTMITCTHVVKIKIKQAKLVHL